MREVSAGEFEIIAANAARNLVDVGDSAPPVGQRKRVRYGERIEFSVAALLDSSRDSEAFV